MYICLTNSKPGCTIIISCQLHTSVSASSTHHLTKVSVKIDTMAKKRQFNEQGEIFFLNAEKVEVNKTVYVEIQDFSERIDDEENKKKLIISSVR